VALYLVSKASPATEQDRNWCWSWPRQAAGAEIHITPPPLFSDFTSSKLHHSIITPQLPEPHLCICISAQIILTKTASCCSPFSKISYESSRAVAVNRKHPTRLQNRTRFTRCFHGMGRAAPRERPPFPKPIVTLACDRKAAKSASRAMPPPVTVRDLVPVSLDVERFGECQPNRASATP
jgi:hypothetical protein